MTPDETKKQTMERQPLWATIMLGLCVMTGLIAMAYVRIKTNEIPVGLLTVTNLLAGGLLTSAMRRRV